jgi:D-3-phosphoglycerate dehydrogenase
VLAVEPPAADHPLFALPNVVFTSHTAGCDRQALRDMAVCAARNIVDLYQGRWPDEAIVNAELRQGWSW